MTKPLTDATRQALREWAENVTIPSSWYPQSEIDQATAYLRYEATLQATDATIAALVKALEEIRDMTVCDTLADRGLRAAMAAGMAIKEATDGS